MKWYENEICRFFPIKINEIATILKTHRKLSFMVTEIYNKWRELGVFIQQLVYCFKSISTQVLEVKINSPSAQSKYTHCLRNDH